MSKSIYTSSQNVKNYTHFPAKMSKSVPNSKPKHKNLYQYVKIYTLFL